jgi:hypothetical protein
MLHGQVKRPPHRLPHPHPRDGDRDDLHGQRRHDPQASAMANVKQIDGSITELARRSAST